MINDFSHYPYFVKYFKKGLSDTLNSTYEGYLNNHGIRL